ncbi:MAG: chemotaxis protein CheW [Leptospiraceae bacterium]|nr:chemotaxis protein CheW [Leptospiraceae bacterium]
MADRYTELFLDEASEHIEDLNQNLLRLERDGFDQETINEIFRSAHTLKSSAAFVGLDSLSSLAHHMEDLFQKVKDGDLKVSTDVVNLFFRCLDRIKAAVAVVADGGKPDDRFQDLLEELETYVVADSPAASSPAPTASEPGAAVTAPALTSISTAPESKQHFIELSESELPDLADKAGKQTVFDGHVVLDREAPMRNMRMLLLLMNLRKIGQVYRTNPPEADLESGAYEGNTMDFIFYGDAKKDTVLKVSQVDMVEEVYLNERSLPQKGETQEVHQARTASRALNTDETVIKTRNIKVSSEKIDYLLNSVGELVITNSGLQKIYEDLTREIGESHALGELKSKIDQAARIARDLQSGIMKTRMIPVGLAFHRFPRPVRDLALSLGKEVDLVFQGEDTELDKNIIDALNDPLLHLLRNALDHGIEKPAEREEKGKNPTATLLLNAFQSGNNIYVEIKDDGRGMNRKAIAEKAVALGLIDNTETMSDEEVYNLIFHPGFSTAREVTDVSGRGVGMNVVRKMVQEFKGSIQVQNNPGAGCSFILSFPLTLAIISAILVRIRGEEYAFPLSDVVETIRLTQSDITTLQGKDIINLRGEILPVFRLRELMGLPLDGEEEEEFPVVIANVAGRKVGYIVDGMAGKKEIVIKSLEQNYKSIRGLIGACLMGDGSIVMVLDVHGLLDLATRIQSRRRAQEEVGQRAFEGVHATDGYNERVRSIAWSGRRRRGARSESDAKEVTIASVAAQSNGSQANGSAPVAGSASLSVEQAGPSGTSHLSTASSDSGSAGTLQSVTIFGQEDSGSSKTLDGPQNAAGSAATDLASDATARGGNADGGNRSSVELLSDEDSEGISQALQEFEKEKADRIRTAKEIYGGRESHGRDLSEDEYNKLYSVINTGMINAGLVLSQLLGVTVEVAVPEFTTVEYSDLTKYVPGERLISVALETEGDFYAMLLLVFDETTGYEAAGELMGVPEGQRKQDSMSVEDVESVLNELTNIVGSSILNELANKTSMAITPTVPLFMSGSVQDLLKIVQEKSHPEMDSRLIYISTDFFREDTELLGRLFMLPSRPNLVELVSRLSG